MSRLRWMGVAFIAFVFLVATLSCAWTKRTTTNTTPAALAARVELRRAFLTAEEARRIEIANDLEFSPQILPRPFPFREICLIPQATPAAVIDPHRSLFVHDRATLDSADFSLRRTLTQIATQVKQKVPGTSALSIFRQFWDTQNPPPPTGFVASSPHCTDNGNTVNGYPIQCRAEGMEASGPNSAVDSRLDEYPVLALINRLDLAHQGWRNCGEFRIIYGKGGDAFGKNLIIFEAVLPNPKPGCREGCLPVAQFWKSLSTIDDWFVRAEMLEKFYYNGLPGFRPVVHVDHYSATGVSGSYGSSGSGQIRTNQFLSQPWTLKEFKTVIDCAAAPCTFNFVPIMVKVNPFPELWNESNPHPNGPGFRADTVAQLASLSSGELMKIGYAVDQRNDDGESISQGQGEDNYLIHMNAAGPGAVSFRTLLALNPAGLSEKQIANRALTQSCHGCHQPPKFGLNVSDSIGQVLKPVGSPGGPTIDHWPNSLNFVHVGTNIPIVLTELAPTLNSAPFDAGLGQPISPALLDFFLPDRKNFLLGQLNAPTCNCVHRFGFLTAEYRVRALEIEGRVHGDFVKRLEEIEKRSDNLDVTQTEDDPKLRAELIDARERILAERDRALASELAKAGIKLPDDEMLSLGPTSIKLTSSAAERTKAVNELVKKEPPRRTVTGTFRAH